MGNWKTVKHKCPKCGRKKARLIDTCIIYDKYYICLNKKCGFADFDDSRKLTKAEDKAREEALGVLNREPDRVKVSFT